MTQADTSFKLSVRDADPLCGYRWDAAVAPRAVVYIAHGMGEHAQRYGRFARFLNAAGVTVYAFDQRGHGEAARAVGLLGHFADADGWRLAVSDIAALSSYVGHAHPGLPRLFFGHSMGSMLGQEYLIEHSHELDGAILSGTGGGQGPLLLAGRAVAAVERRRIGGRSISAVLDKLSFGGYNLPFRPARTDYDWLSRDPVEVDAYIADPLCGGTLTVQSWADMLDGLRQVEQLARQKQITPSLPVYLFSGDRDPVGRAGSGPRWLANRYAKAGLQDVELHLYPEGRHEMLNEINRGQVQAGVLAFINRVIG